MKNYIALFAVSKENLKTYNIIFLEKELVLSIICSKCKNEYEKLVIEEELIEILKILGLTKNI